MAWHIVVSTPRGITIIAVPPLQSPSLLILPGGALSMTPGMHRIDITSIITMLHQALHDHGVWVALSLPFSPSPPSRSALQLGRDFGTQQ